MKHPYNVTCPCDRCVKERDRRLEQSKDKAESKRQASLYRQAKRHYDNGDHDYSMNG